MRPNGQDPASRLRKGDGEIAPGRPELLREVNARRVLRLLRLYGPCSRADLTRRSGLSAPTVSTGVAYLQKKGLVKPVGPGASNGGRPPRLLRFNSQLGYVVSAQIRTSEITLALADLNGTVLGKWVGSTRSNCTPLGAATLIAAGIRKLQAQHRVPSSKLIALTAGVPGITDARARTVLSAPNLPSGWQSVPFGRILEKKTGISAGVENDVNLAALGESWLGIARGVRNFVFLIVDAGVGAGIFVDGRLHHGSDWAAGEIGYLYVPGTDENPLAIRRPGSLESIIGTKGIIRSWRRLSKQNGKGRHGLPRDAGISEIFGLAERGEPQARALLERTARVLADAITNVCVVLNSFLVVFGGQVGSNPALFDTTRRILERNDFCRPRLALSALGSEATLFGGIRLALKAAERKILPSAIDPSGVLTSEDVSGFFQPFLGVSRPD